MNTPVYDTLANAMYCETMRWKRLDSPGHDACRLRQTGNGWQLEGKATFPYRGRAARLTYHAHCDLAWRSQSAHVTGRIDAASFSVSLARESSGAWQVNGQTVAGLNTCEDLDLGFTPATNLFHVRRLALPVGGVAEVTAAWLDFPACQLEPLRQRYERRSEFSYWYEAPRFHYAALLTTDPSGFVRHYPGLWEAVPLASSP